MAMLAEPRRRQKIGPNPRGKFFQEEGGNKGRDLLHKLGWKEGDGLGLERQGMTDPIKARSQMDSKGLGYNPLNDPWILHNEEFSQVLSNLNKEYKGDEAKPEKQSIESLKLENKSKGSKARIHYPKFVKSKDLSKISSKEWSCIFGKANEVAEGEASDEAAQVPEDGNIEKPDEENLTQNVKIEPVEESLKTINRGSINDYFKSKFEEKLRAIGKSNYFNDTNRDEVPEEPEESVRLFKQTEHCVVKEELLNPIAAQELEPQTTGEESKSKRRKKQISNDMKKKDSGEASEELLKEKIIQEEMIEPPPMTRNEPANEPSIEPEMLKEENETSFANSPYLRKRFRILPAHLKEVDERFKGSNLFKLPGYGNS